MFTRDIYIVIQKNYILVLKIYSSIFVILWYTSPFTPVEFQFQASSFTCGNKKTGLSKTIGVKKQQTKHACWFYIWPTSVHSTPLFTFGLDYNKLSGVLDNSPNKIGKYIYGYNLLCSSLNELLRSDEKNVCVFISGAGNYIKELDLTNTNIEIININEI